MLEQVWLTGVALAAGAALLASGAGRGVPPFTDADLVGDFQTAACADGQQWGVDPRGTLGIHFQRRYAFRSNHSFKVHYVFFSDGRCKRPRTAATWQGRWRLGGPARGLAFTRNGDFPIFRLTLTVLSADALLQTTGCGRGGWALGSPKDVTATGCSSLGPLFAPVTPDTVDHDIVYLHRGVFKSGYRTPQMARTPAGRPTRLQDSIPAERQ